MTPHGEGFGATWIKANRPNVSPFGLKLADMLNEWRFGIYHISRDVLDKRVDWSSNSYISFTFVHDLVTCDPDYLTRLVFLAHEYRIRTSIAPFGCKRLRLIFWPRKEEGDYSEKHPSLTQAYNSFMEKRV